MVVVASDVMSILVWKVEVREGGRKTRVFNFSDGKIEREKEKKRLNLGVRSTHDRS